MGEWIRVNWAKQALGIKNDTEIANKLGVTRDRVRKAREDRGIEPCANTRSCARKGIDWDNQPIGKEPDTLIAGRLGVSSVTVLQARRTRGVPAFVRPKLAKVDKKKGSIDWDNQPLGIDPDNSISSKLGIAASTVRRARIERGIEVSPQSRKFAKKGIDWDKQPLGEVKDSDIARALGLDENSVRYARKKRGIPKFSIQKWRGQYGSTDWDNEPLGKIPDADLAMMLGLTNSAVCKARSLRGIPAYKKRSGIKWTNR